jgi:hypothetical protein
VVGILQDARTCELLLTYLERIDVSDTVSQWQAFQKGSKQFDTTSEDIGIAVKLD